MKNKQNIIYFLKLLAITYLVCLGLTYVSLAFYINIKYVITNYEIEKLKEINSISSYIVGTLMTVLLSAFTMPNILNKFKKND